MDALPVDGIEIVIDQAVEKAFHNHAAVTARVPSEALSFTMIGFSQATGIGSTTLYEDARTGKLKTHILGKGKRIKRIIMRDDGLEYLRAFPLDHEGGA